MPRTIVTAYILIAFGLFALAYQGITYTMREKTLDIGPVEVVTEKKRTIPLPPVVGAVAITVGIIMLGVGHKR